MVHHLTNSNFSLEISDDLFKSFRNLKKIDDNVKKEEMEDYIYFFEELYSLKITNNDGETLSYLDYIIKNRDEYIEKYTNNDIDPPFSNKIISIYEKLGEKKIKGILELDKFFDNKKLKRGIMLVLSVLARQEEYGDIIINKILKIFS